jgi:predicted Zn-dependent protease with MMP-like domain
MFDGSNEEAGSVDFEQSAQDAIDGLPAELREAMSNVSVVIEDEPPPGQPLLGLYQGVPLTRRGSYYGGVLPDKITIYRGPLLRLYGSDADVLRAQIRHVVLHEVAHHFGISDQRLLDMGRY